MKKLIFAILFTVISTAVMSQSINWKKFIDDYTLTSDTSWVITTSGVYSSWNITIVCGTHTSTTTTVSIEVSPDGVNWVDYADLAEATLTTGGIVAFEDAYVASRWMRVTFDVEDGESVPVTGWYIFKDLR
jgi:hypothetical protein